MARKVLVVTIGFLLLLAGKTGAQYTLRATVVDFYHPATRIKGLMVKLTSRDLVYQHPTGDDGRVDLSDRRLRAGQVVRLQIRSEQYEIPDGQEIEWNIGDVRDVVIKIARKGAVRESEKKFVDSALFAYNKRIESQLEKIMRVLKDAGNQPNSLATKQLLRDSVNILNRKRTPDSTLIQQSRQLYSSSLRDGASTSTKIIAGLMKKGQVDEARKFQESGPDTLSGTKADAGSAAVTADDRFQRALFYQSVANFKNANELLRRVVREMPDNLSYKKHYIEFLIFSVDQSSEALPLLRSIDLDGISSERTRMDLMNDYGAAFRELSRNDSALPYYQRQLETLNKATSLDRTTYVAIKARILANIGNLFEGVNDSLSIAYTQKAYDLIRNDLDAKVGDTLKILVTCATNLGVKYHNRGVLPLAYRYYDTALAVLARRKTRTDEEINAYLKAAQSKLEITIEQDPGLVNGPLVKAYEDTILQLNNASGNSLLFKLREFYATQGDQLFNQGSYRPAFRRYLQALEAQRGYYADSSVGLTVEIGNLFRMTGYCMKMFERNDSAVVYFDSSFNAYSHVSSLIEQKYPAGSIDFVKGKIGHYRNLANLYKAKGEKSKRLASMEEAERLLEKHSLPDSLYWPLSVGLNSDFSSYFKVDRQFPEALARVKANLSAYRTHIHNFFINEPVVAQLLIDAGDLVLQIAQTNDSLPVYRQSMEFYGPAVPMIEKLFAADSSNLFTLADLYYSVALAYQRTHGDSAAKYFGRCLPMFEDLYTRGGDKKMLIYLYNIHHTMLVFTRDSQSATWYHLIRAMAVVRMRLEQDSTNGDIQNDKASVLNAMGTYYSNIKAKDSAIICFTEALDILDRNFRRNQECLGCWVSARENWTELSRGNIGPAKELRIHEEDIDFLENTLHIDSLGRYLGSARNIRNFFITYERTAFLYFHAGRNAEAITYLKKGIYLLDRYRVDDRTGMSYYNDAYNNMSFYQLVNKEPEKAVGNALLALQNTLRSDTSTRAGNTVNLVFAYIYSGQFGKARSAILHFKTDYPSFFPDFAKMVNGDRQEYEGRGMIHKDFERLQELLK